MKNIKVFGARYKWEGNFEFSYNNGIEVFVTHSSNAITKYVTNNFVFSKRDGFLSIGDEIKIPLEKIINIRAEKI